MLQDIPYSVLQDNKRSYEIMILRDQHSNSFSDIAIEHSITSPCVISHYSKIKIRQIRLYINHLSVVNNHDSTAHFREIFRTAYNCYQDYQCAAAYLEKEYRVILIEYRAGEPGMPEQFLAKLPPLRKNRSRKTIDRVIEMREVEKKTYAEIGKQLRMTRQCAEHLYQSFYHKKVLAILEHIEKETGEKVWDLYFRSSHQAKKRYEMIRRDYPELSVDDLTI